MAYFYPYCHASQGAPLKMGQTPGSVQAVPNSPHCAWSPSVCCGLKMAAYRNCSVRAPYVAGSLGSIGVEMKEQLLDSTSGSGGSEIGDLPSLLPSTVALAAESGLLFEDAAGSSLSGL
ncbi:hypothetical protein XENOCAPTIV_023131 [Xenoophorus captivus]|uniref:Uncharacterized protein n=1 Tax=Xenoophorus captivus TaxID=1517983 RepID=A0ABV0S0W6_9TELE